MFHRGRGAAKLQVEDKLDEHTYEFDSHGA